MKTRRLDTPVKTFTPVTVELTFETPDELVWTLARLNECNKTIRENNLDYPLERYPEGSDKLWQFIKQIYRQKLMNSKQVFCPKCNSIQTAQVYDGVWQKMFHCSTCMTLIEAVAYEQSELFNPTTEGTNA